MSIWILKKVTCGVIGNISNRSVYVNAFIDISQEKRYTYRRLIILEISREIR